MIQAVFHRGAAVIAAVAAAGLVWSVGFDGFMPLDQAIVWDGAWRLLQGEAPYADYIVPFGLVPSAIQAVLFRLGGVSWTSYVVHAALANAAFALAVYAVLCRLFARPWLPLVYALFSAVALYPPVGTPYPDHHALLFAALMFAVVLWDTSSPRPSPLRWALLPFVAVLAFLSKQTPAVLATGWIALMAAVLALRWRHGGRSALLGLVLGTLAAIVAGAALLAWSGIALDDVRLSLLDLPSATGRERIEPFYLRRRLRDLGEVSLLPILAVLVLRWRSLLAPAQGSSGMRDWTLHAGATGLVVVFALFTLTSDNSRWFAFGAMPLAAGLAHALVIHGGATAGWQRYLGPAIAGLMALEMLLLHVDTTIPRAANDLRRADWAAAEDGALIDPRLAGLRWLLPPPVTLEQKAEGSARAYHELLDLLRAREGNFLLIGDATILYALAGRPSAFPALWFHPGLSYRPGPDFDARIAQAMARHDVRRVVIDGERTWQGASAADFAPIARCLARATETVPVGRFRVVELPPGCAAR